MITLIGTGHVFNLTEALYTIFDEKKPNLICVELDSQRYQALLMKQQHPEQYEQAAKNAPFIYRILARFQENMANEYGVIAGSEMIAAITYAQTYQLPVEFIDMNAQQIFTKMWKSMKISEKLKLLFTGFGSLFISKKTVEKELEHIQENLTTYLDEIGKKFPTIKKTLIDDRNIYMTQKLLHLHTKYTNIIACVGDGHIPGMDSLLKENHIDVNMIRLHELQQQKTQDTDSASAHFSIGYKQL